MRVSFSVAVCVLALHALVSSAAVVGPLTKHLQEHPALEDWRPTGRPVDRSAMQSLLVALKQSNLDKLNELFYAVSTPGSPSYSQYLSQDELREVVAPSAATLSSVTEWFVSAGGVDVDFVAHKDAFRVRMARQDIEKLFGVRLQELRHKEDGRILYRALEEIHIPAKLAQHIDIIKGVNDLPLFRKRKALRAKEFTDMPLPSSAIPEFTAASTPSVTMAAARAGSFMVQFIPVCQDGSTSTSTTPCADHPPAIDAIQLTANTTSDVVNKEYSLKIPLGAPSGGSTQFTCTVQVPQGSSSNMTVCTVQLTADTEGWIAYWNPVTVGVQTYFGSTLGPIGANAHPVVRLPAVTPQTIARQYSIPPNTVVVNSSFKQCVVEFEQQYYSPTDLLNFFEKMGLPTDTPVTVIGPNDPNSGVEANLDIQYIMGVAPGVPTVFWSIKANSSVEIDDILSWEIAIGNTTDPPIVNSLSYGMTADHVDKYLGKGYITRSDVEFQKLALRGLTIIIACGDTGAGDLGPPPMSEPNCTKLHPDWPSQSPYVTAIGSTAITPNAEPICYLQRTAGGINCDNNPLGEIGVSLDQGILFTTGGGFSERTARPQYQEAAVSAYMAQAKARGLLPPPSTWNSSGRAYPDMATVGHNLMVSQDIKFIAVDGTSASAPIFGGVISLLNAVRLDNGQRPLGFVNPLMYSIAAKTPDAFYDVTVGDNACGAYGWQPLCCAKAYTALPGFDPVSGLGSPNYSVLSKEVLTAGRS